MPLFHYCIRCRLRRRKKGSSYCEQCFKWLTRRK